MKKKILSLMLAMVMMLSLSVTALAATGVTVTQDGNTWTVVDETDPENPVTYTYTDAASVSFTKTFKLIGDGKSPAENFSFTITQGDWFNIASTDNSYRSDGPTLTVGSASFDEGDANEEGASETLTITLPGVDPTDTTGASFPGVGIYTYKITENVPDTSNGGTIDAGVAYNTGDSAYYLLKVTVILVDGHYIRVVAIYNENGKKVDGTEGGEVADFENTYTANTLSVTKNVTGNLGDTTLGFEFKITFSCSDTTLNVDYDAITVSTKEGGVSDGTWDADHKVYTVNLKSGETVYIDNIPEGVTYEVNETKDDEDGYTTTYSRVVGSSTADNVVTDEMGEAAVAYTVTNDKDSNIDTGISLDSLPYILMLIVVAAGVVVMISRRRLTDRF